MWRKPKPVMWSLILPRLVLATSLWQDWPFFVILFVSLPVDPDDPFKLTDETRQLGLAVCRGTAVVLICPVDGMEPIANPFLQQEWWQLVLQLLLLCTIIHQHYCSSLVDSQSCKLTELWTPKTFQECLLCEDQLQKRSKHLNQPLNHRLAAAV